MSKQWCDAVAVIYNQLENHRPLWEQSSFGQNAPPWATLYSSLHDWLLSIPDEMVEQYEAKQSHLLADAAKHLPSLVALIGIIEVEHSPKPLLTPYNPRQFAHVPGRKMEQISHFVAALPASSNATLEWCSGKGHLGRLLHQQHSCAVTSLEYDRSLCDSGENLAQRSNSNQRFVCQDALSKEAESSLAGIDRAVALHACGDLHLKMMTLCVNTNVAEIACSPCCYHLTSAERYQPLSDIAKRYDLKLSKEQLRLAVLQTATAPQRVKALRATEVSFRLGLKALLASLKCTDDGLGSCRKAVFSDGFESFCGWALRKLDIALEHPVDWDKYERLGQQAWAKQRRYELARQLFRPALELYLNLDRCLYLEQNGYAVTLSTFCEPQITPRNTLIYARRLSC